MADRLETLKAELAQIKKMRCLSFGLKEKCAEWYEHEIECIERYQSGCHESKEGKV